MVFVLQESEEHKGATSWPEFYIDQLRVMAAVSKTLHVSLTNTSTETLMEAFHSQRKTLLALEDEDEQGRHKIVEDLKTALRTQPMR